MAFRLIKVPRRKKTQSNHWWVLDGFSGLILTVVDFSWSNKNQEPFFGCSKASSLNCFPQVWNAMSAEFLSCYPPCPWAWKWGIPDFWSKGNAFTKSLPNRLSRPHFEKKKNWDFQNGVAQMCWSKPGFSSLLWRDFTDTSSPFFPFPSVRTCKDRISTWQLKINHPCIQGTIEAAWRVAKEVPSWHGFFFRRNVGDSELWLTPEKFGEWIHKMKLCKR